MFWKRSATLQIGSRRYDMSNLYFEFDVPFKDSDTLGVASITVHNLAEATRKEIVKGTPVILNAGYEGDIGVIFTGKVSRVVDEHSDTEWITKITGVEALEEWLSSEVNKTYAENSTSSSIINDLLTMFGLEVGTMELVEDKTYSRGRVCKGKVKDVLKEIVTLDCKSRFLIRNGTVIISDPAAGQDMGYELSAFQCIPVRFLFWEGDEEFPAQGNLLFDAGATDFIHGESIVTIASVGLSRLAAAAGVPMDSAAFVNV